MPYKLQSAVGDDYINYNICYTSYHVPSENIMKRNKTSSNFDDVINYAHLMSFDNYEICEIEKDSLVTMEQVSFRSMHCQTFSVYSRCCARVSTTQRQSVSDSRDN